ncbi:MAG: FG-GAP-like repeat-containing protein [Armatimonadota bacterium]|jgi:outer membrane protein assembly factor BamB
MHRRSFAVGLLTILVCGSALMTDAAADLRSEQLNLLSTLEISADDLTPRSLETPIVVDGAAVATICHADDPAWREAAMAVQTAISDATGVEVPLASAADLSDEEAFGQSLILLGHLDNNRHVARLYHNFYVCLDTGYAGAEGYIIRSAHDPWGRGFNAVLVGGSTAAGTANAAAAFAEIIADATDGASLSLGRQMVLEIGEREFMTPDQRDLAIEQGRATLFAPGEGRSGVSRLTGLGTRYHRTGDPLAGEAYRAMMHALVEYFETDSYISTEPLSRYDRDFRDAWTYQVGLLWDLCEESELFSDEERVKFTNMVIRLMLECDLYQRYEDRLEMWGENTRVPHNHNTFPALGAYFIGEYALRHYPDHAALAARAEMWLEVAEGVFRGLKHSPKPLEDSAAYVWLPLQHVMTYSLATGDTTFLDEGHGLAAAEVAMITMDNAGYQAAYGDHSAYTAASGIAEYTFKVAWYHRDPAVLWITQHAGGANGSPLGQSYHIDIEPQPPAGHVGLRVAELPPAAYTDGIEGSPYPKEPQVPLEDCFDKMSFRAGLERDDAYMLIDGFGRGTHMHWDANAIIRYSHGGEPLLVDGEYIKNAPKYHNAVVIIRDGQSEDAPAVTELVRADDLQHVSFAQTRLPQCNEAAWTRSVVWRPNDYVLVVDEIEALADGDFTLRCCWRPWGDATLEDGVCTVTHRPMQLQVCNLDGAPSTIEEMKVSANMPIQRLSQQVSRRLSAGESYRFANVIASSPVEEPREVAARRVGAGLFVIDRPEGAEVIALGPEGLVSAGIEGEAALVLIGEGLLVTTGVTALSPEGACELAELPTAAAEVRERVLAMPVAPATVDGAGLAAPELRRAWVAGGFDAPMEALPVVAISADAEHAGRLGPVEKLVDGQYASSAHSVQWAPGVTPTVTMELAAETLITTIELRDWSSMNEQWAIGSRRLQVSSDGFDRDVRDLGEAFEEIGTQQWRSNVNTILEAPVNQRARQVRLIIEPAGDEARVYLAEAMIRGTRPGALPRITAIASGPHTRGTAGEPTGAGAVVAGSDSGQIRAFDADGDVMWSWQAEGRARINALACADLDGDGRDEVIYGDNGARLGALSADGEPRWEVTPPRYRGINSDVMNITPADLDGDGLPEIVVGLRSWQYAAYTGEGELLWTNVIYAHPATVSVADDFDGDGLPEIVGGNEYYRLNLIDTDGTRIYSRDRFGPEQSAVASADLDADGLPEIVMGTDLGELICFEGMTGARRWTRNVGDRVTRIVAADITADGVEEIVCAAESANVYAFAGDGELLWRTALPAGVSDLALLPGDEIRLAAVAGAAGVVLLDGSGSVVAVGPTDEQAEALALIDGRVVVTMKAGRLAAFEFTD